MAGLVLVACFLSILFSGVAGVLKKEEIDDAEVGPYSLTTPPLATIAFFPPNNGYWGTQQGAPQTMVAVADAVRAQEGTYTAASSFAGSTPRSIVIDFFGTSITPYFTLSNNFATEVDITLDDRQLYSMRHVAGSRNEDFSYKVPGVSYVNLSPGQHRMEIKVVAFTESRLNFVSFDYAEFSYDSLEAEAWQNRTSSRSSPDVEQEKVGGGNQTAAIVGGTIGGAAVLAALVLVIYFRSRRSRDTSHTSDSSSIEKIPPGGHHSLHPRRQSVFPRWFGSFTAAHSGSSRDGPTPDPSTMPSISTHQPHPGGSGSGRMGGGGGDSGDRHSMVSSHMSASTKAHPLYLHIGPDGNSQWLSSPSEVHRLHLNSMSPPIHHGSPNRRNSDDRLDSLGLHLNTIQTPKTPYQTVASPGGASIAAAARELHTPYQYSIPDPPPPGHYSSSDHR